MESVKSPCIRECKISEGKCAGCGRTLSEISNWRTYSDEQKAAVINRIKVDSVWPDLTFQPINLLVLHSARWL